MEEAYKMDDHVRILCQDHYCSLTCKRGVEIPQVSKIVCKNARRNKTGFEKSHFCVFFFWKLSVFAFRELNLKKPLAVGSKAGKSWGRRMWSAETSNEMRPDYATLSDRAPERGQGHVRK